MTTTVPLSEPNPPTPPIPAATKLRQRFSDPGAPILVCPGVYDGFSARIALSVGFDALYMTGAGTSASLLGHADLGIATATDMRNHAEMLANISPSTPLIADADTGYGGPINVARIVQAYARAGVAGMHIEDQVVTKRCGHLGGKELVDLDVYLARIRAAVAARKKIGSDIVIIARTDALQKFGWEEAVRRLKASRECGADVAFLEGVRTKEEAGKVAKELEGMPCLLNMVHGGATPGINAKEAQSMGYRAVIFPFAALSPAYYAIKKSMEELKNTGELAEDGKLPPKDVFEVCGLEESLKVDEEAGGVSYANGV